jgi:hypothetical protein
MQLLKNSMNFFYVGTGLGALLIIITNNNDTVVHNTRNGWLLVREREEPWSLLLEISHIGRLRDQADQRPMSQIFLRLTIFQLRCSKTTKKNEELFSLPSPGPTRLKADPQPLRYAGSLNSMNSLLKVLYINEII